MFLGFFFSFCCSFSYFWTSGFVRKLNYPRFQISFPKKSTFGRNERKNWNIRSVVLLKAINQLDLDRKKKNETENLFVIQSRFSIMMLLHSVTLYSTHIQIVPEKFERKFIFHISFRFVWFGLVGIVRDWRCVWCHKFELKSSTLYTNVDWLPASMCVLN